MELAVQTVEQRVVRFNFASFCLSFKNLHRDTQAATTAPTTASNKAPNPTTAPTRTRMGIRPPAGHQGAN